MSARSISKRSASAARGGLRRVSVAILLSLTLGLVSSTTVAQDTGALHRDVVGASDFRVRVASALALGKKKDPASLSPLTKALSDANPAVRSAAAAALGSIADPRSQAGLEAAKAAESDAGVRRSIDQALALVKRNSKTKYIVSIGRLENKSGNPKMDAAFRSVAKAEISRLPNVEVADSDQAAVAKAKEKKLPTIALDGRLVGLDKATMGADVGYAARVEFVVRKIPEQALKASVKGNAKALASKSQVKTDSQIAQLQNDAVTAAVQSALENAPTALEAASK